MLSRVADSVRPYRLALAVVSLAVVLGSQACSDESGKPDDCVVVQNAQVTIDGTVAGWEPACLEVKVGAQVAFTANLLDELPHDLKVSGPGLDEAVSSGEPVTGGTISLEVAFDEAGTYEYVCSVHANMKGDVYVEP